MISVCRNKLYGKDVSLPTIGPLGAFFGLAESFESCSPGEDPCLAPLDPGFVVCFENDRLFGLRESPGGDPAGLPPLFGDPALFGDPGPFGDVGEPGRELLYVLRANNVVGNSRTGGLGTRCRGPVLKTPRYVWSSVPQFQLVGTGELRTTVPQFQLSSPVPTRRPRPQNPNTPKKQTNCGHDFKNDQRPGCKCIRTTCSAEDPLGRVIPLSPPGVVLRPPHDTALVQQSSSVHPPLR